MLFYLVYYGGISFTESYNFPIGLRRYMFERLVKEIENKNKAIEKASKKSSSRFG
jgi:hypothetical protein|tara:strand:- start:80 stop:244 length:165 start_codon:yes stop_codon:yes gene_type:complete